ncbi:SusC/RagA family TonB-linked outer membrane protein [Maribacter sp. ACAM166]|uniref:SusC/RagA family TonB-linked outer membrane protein n=1 Tax=Maribacter sp. ACAM166 TaxID=2508996 RepID=UPI0010FCE915|nr:TonB-dependent receptor [Maribacter sp. ACAM166]TLP70537.1 TonB-dependent receptor [Maribacter sp. ACAM166]
MKTNTHKELFKYLSILFGFFIGSSAIAQSTVSGTVTDNFGEPLIGATILVKNTNRGVVADFNGKYSIETNIDETLVFSYAGFNSIEIAIENQILLDVVMTEGLQQLSEVVVVGYGEQKYSNISGSVSVIAQKEIKRNPTANLSNALVGQSTGIIATQRSGAPGEDASNIFIRGIGTLGNASPIYVIDGIVRPASDFNQLSSNEIESFSVLKDAASAAVFGIRAGNGVILVTTKRGVEGKMQIDFSTNIGVQQTTRTPEYLGSYEYAKLYNEGLANQGDTPLYSQDDLQKYLDQSSPDTHPSSNWTEEILKKTATIRKYNLSATGGNEKLRYATSLSYLNQDGIVPSNNFKRYNFRSNIDADVTNTTRLSFDLSGRDEQINNISLSDPINSNNNIFRQLSWIPPIRFPVKWSNGEYPGNPVYAALPENGYRNKRVQAFRGRIQLLQQLPIEGLSIKGIVSYDKTFTGNKNWTFFTQPFFTRGADNTFEEQPLPANSLNQDHFDNQSITLETHLNYEKTIGKNQLSGLLLYTQTEDNWNFLGAFREGFTLGIDEMDFGGATNRNNSGYSGSSGRQGVVGRVNFTHDDKYILETSFRVDGSEQFAKDKRWGFFPSATAAYVISKEKFLESSSIDLLKIRGSYGILGNDRLQGARFLYLQSFNVNGNAVFGDANVEPAIVEGNLSNPNVTWETVKKLNIGLDAILWGGKLSANVDFFLDKRSDILAFRNASVPSLLGVGLPVENLAKVDNSGIEFALGHRGSISKDLRYSMNANFTYARNKVVFIDEPIAGNLNIRRTGRPLGTEFGYQDLGLFQNQGEVDNAASQIGTNVGPGDIRYKDVNGDGAIDDLDRVEIGRGNTPEIIFGYIGGLTYKNLDLSFLFQGATNVNQFYTNESAWPFHVGAGARKSNLDSWTPTNTNASQPRVLITQDNMNQIGNSSYWLRDASYVRLKNIELSYNVPLEALGQKFIKGLRIYINANNVFTWSKIENFDPENGDRRGWDHPQLKIWNAGVNFQF